jgi:hypothetical protein
MSTSILKWHTASSQPILWLNWNLYWGFVVPLAVHKTRSSGHVGKYSALNQCCVTNGTKICLVNKTPNVSSLAPRPRLSDRRVDSVSWTCQCESDAILPYLDSYLITFCKKKFDQHIFFSIPEPRDRQNTTHTLRHGLSRLGLRLG